MRWLALLWPFGALAANSTLVGIPTMPFNTTGDSFDLTKVSSIVVDSRFQDSVDNDGKTLIPPTLLAFAHTFQADLQTLGLNVPVDTGRSAKANSVFLTLTNDTAFVDAAGRPTSEAYSLSVSLSRVTISGASPLGTWWGTRTIMQQAVLGNMSIPVGSGVDSPGWGTRGIMLDAGRHFYPAEFLVELCSYISFFKQNTFHVHLSDNLNNNPRYTREQSLSLYAAFRLNSPSPALEGLVKRPNETYTREVFHDIQTRCASRGVTIIPELEAPGHALVITQWKPELGLQDLSLLNISFPQTIPTMKTIWQEFLPWFHTKTVHIGADEYDSSLADDYNLFVNTMSNFIQQTSGKDIRIWGTNEPGKNSTVSTNVTIQHWEFFEDNPLTLLKQGYNVLNSDDAFYIVAKFSTSYPQSLNITRIFHGAPDGGPYAPNIFDLSNATNNPPRNHPGVVGHIVAQWNDFGPNATSVLEVYYDWKSGLAGLADKQWGGVLTEEEYRQIFDTLHMSVPGQNLDRKIHSKSSTILKYNFTKAVTNGTVPDLSGNGYDGTLRGGASVDVKEGVVVFPRKGSILETPLTSKGPNYTLSFSVNPSQLPGTFFSSPDSNSSLVADTNNNITLITGGNAYALNYTLPLNTWTQLDLITRGTETSLRVNGGDEMPFKAILGINGQSFVWANISVVAPLKSIGGFVGMMRDIVLVDGAP